MLLYLQVILYSNTVFNTLANFQPIFHRYVPGDENAAADAFSWINVISLIDSDFFHKVAEEQLTDDELKKLQTGSSSLSLTKIPVFGTDKEIVYDRSAGHERLYLPSKFRKQIFRNLQNQSHLGIRASTKLISARYVRSFLGKDIKKWAQACVGHNNASIQAFLISTVRFLDIHIDIVGPLPPSQAYRYLLTTIDRFSRWMEAAPLSEIAERAAAEAFYSERIARYGAPAEVVTDQGRQFESQLFRPLGQICGLNKKRTTAYPQCNGTVERFHRTLEAAYQLHSKHGTRFCQLLSSEYELQSEKTSEPCELVFGQAARLPGEFFT